MRKLNFNEQDWLRVTRDAEAWWAGELERPLVYLTGLPAGSSLPYRFLSNYPDLSPEKVVDIYAPILGVRRYYGDAFPWVGMNFGPGIVAGFLGGQVHSVAEPSETVWFTPPCEPPPKIASLSLAHQADNVWWRRVRDVTAAFVCAYDGKVQVGYTDLGGNLDILASFVTSQQLLIEMIEQPGEVLRVSAEITAAWLRYYDDLDAVIRPTCPGTTCWTPLLAQGKTYMLQSDISYMISPRMFERFVMPDLLTCCEHLDYAFYHLDGKGQIPHLDQLLSIPRLRGVQWIPGDNQAPPEGWLPLLKRIRDRGKLCQLFVSAAGALTIAHELGGKGFLFVITDDPREFAEVDVAEAFLRQLVRATGSRV